MYLCIIKNERKNKQLKIQRNDKEHYGEIGKES